MSRLRRRESESSAAPDPTSLEVISELRQQLRKEKAKLEKARPHSCICRNSNRGRIKWDGTKFGSRFL